jgi:hypothetical protein
MTDTRRKNANWNVGEKITEWDQCQLAVLMDIRDELQALRALASCYRIPRALDACIELGVDLRRKKRLAAKKRKVAKQSGR